MSVIESVGARSYEADVLRTADDISTNELAENPDQPDLLYVRGLLLKRQPGHAAAALACLKRAVTLMPSRADVWLALNALLAREGRWDEALAAALHAVRLGPDNPHTYIHLARTFHRQGRLREAQAICHEAIRLAPALAEPRFELADALREQGASHASAAAAEVGRLLAPREPRGHYRVGLAHLDSGSHVEALACFRRALRLDALDADIYVGAGRACDAAGDRAAAIESYRTALACDPMHDDASRHLVELLLCSSPDDDATGSALHHRGMLLLKHAYYEDARSTLEQAVTIKGDIRSIAGLAHACLATSRAEEALKWARTAVPILADDTAAHIDLATAHHLLGDHDAGWEEFRWLYDAQTLRRRGLERSLWDGSALDGRAILLWTDMGRGDVIQFLRYIPEVNARGGRVLVHCNHPGLIPLVETVPGVDGVFGPRSPIPHHDLHAPLNCLPAFIRECRRSLPHVPYLSIDQTLRKTWQERLGSFAGLTVGLSWGGNTNTLSASSRFLALDTLSSLADIPDTRYVSLQHGPQTSELLALSTPFVVERVLSDDSSIADAAALVTLVDLVISVDTMIAHLAGALGRPVWTLLRRATNWRWTATGATTAWYPTMRLFRQFRDGDWTSVVADVRRALRIVAARYTPTRNERDVISCDTRLTPTLRCGDERYGEREGP